ncbi:serine/threonine-protein kinase LMTK1 isoform X2 [Erpetoichthys calabaricus]|uniref:serine/threonine-protein kinase LMTK1 isoform X2 n=1 Tax=Erpetoichthys calabaricus TaxID=27687 RepID=UPI002234E3D9|nr:serine/threonine-protein kinase LMTK1 isoform X2 [Erpetoichthys calabaricus]
MRGTLWIAVMTLSYFNPGFAFSSHFDPDGAPLSELSWSSSLVVVAVSFSGLFTFIFLMLACLCCKKGDIGFKEFENTDGDEYTGDLSTLASPASQNGPEVYILPLTEVSLPVSKQPGRSVQLLKSKDLARHSLLYLKEIGHGWFGKVLLGEVNAGLSTTQVVVKELKASASVQDQMQFLEETQPYRALQHPNLLQCLAQCSEVTPYLLVMEFCALGDLKGYLRSFQAADSMTPDPLTLQRMACEIASGLLHLHKYNYIHSDLALRNCLLTAEVTVKIGDYGLSHNKYKDDYFVTADQLWVPLRWIAPELIDEVHGNLLVVDQTKPSNIWSLGVTIWELFELGNQPYKYYSDRQVLTYAIKEQQLKLPKPVLKLPLAERWYEVMQFCWLQPDQRPTAEEVHLLLSYLCAKGASEAEEEFEKRWNSLRPNSSNSATHTRNASAVDLPSSSSSSFPLLEQFSGGDSFHAEAGDDILTVTETSHGLNFEYKWEQAHSEQHYHSSSTSGTLGHGNPHYQDIYYPPGSGVKGSASLTLGVSPSYYDSKHSMPHTPDVVPVLSTHSPSVSSEYYIRIEESNECNIDLDYTMCSYSPEFEGSNSSFMGCDGGIGDCESCPADIPSSSFWPGESHKTNTYDSDNSPTISLTMEPLLGQLSTTSPLEPWESGEYYSYKDRERDQSYYYERSSSDGADAYLLEDNSEPHIESWGSRSLRQALGELEDPLGASPSFSVPRQIYSDHYDERRDLTLTKRAAGECYYDMIGSLRETLSSSNSVSMNTDGGDTRQFLDSRQSGFDERVGFSEDDTFTRAKCWSSNSSANNNSLNFAKCSGQDVYEGYAEFHFMTPSNELTEPWRGCDIKENLSFPCSSSFSYLTTAQTDHSSISMNNEHKQFPFDGCNSCLQLSPRIEEDVSPSVRKHPEFLDPLLGAVVKSYTLTDYKKLKENVGLQNENNINSPPAHLGLENMLKNGVNSNLLAMQNGESPVDETKQPVDPGLVGDSCETDGKTEDNASKELKQANSIKSPLSEESLNETSLHTNTEMPSESSKTTDSGLEKDNSSVSLDENDKYSDDITDVTSGIFTDFPDTVDATPAFKSLQKQVGTPDSMESLDMPSICSGEVFSPTNFHSTSQPKALDSGYDTENNESPEFVLKEPHEPRDSESFTQPLGKSAVSGEIGYEDTGNGAGINSVMLLSSCCTPEIELRGLTDKNPYRDSAYFSDYDNESEKCCQEPGDVFQEKLSNHMKTAGTEKEESFAVLEMGDSSLAVEGKDMESQQNQINKKELEQGNNSEQTLNDQTHDTEANSGSVTEITTVNDGIEAELIIVPSLSLSQSTSKDVTCLTKELSSDEVLAKDIEILVEKPESTSKFIPEVNPGSLDEALSSSEKATVESFGTECQEAAEDKNELSDHNEKKTEKDQRTCNGEATSCELQKVDTTPHTSLESFSDPELAAKEDLTLEHPKESLVRHSVRSPPPDHLRMETRVSPADGEEADEEDGDSDDSEESDEELCCYNIQEQSEESEEEFPTVPVVISDSSDAQNLRSLLKMPTLLSESLCEELDRKKKAVSFFDDVTVYLFDQESPTRELGEQSFPQGAEASGHCSGTGISSQDRITASDDSSDGNISEEISTPTASRFSITHVSDSDIDSVGGSSEDGERE